MIVSRDPLEPVTAEQVAALRARWPDGTRLALAWRLARDIETCGALIAGRAVDRDRLDPTELKQAYEQRLVRLERPIDLLEGVA